MSSPSDFSVATTRAQELSQTARQRIEFNRQARERLAAIEAAERKRREAQAATIKTEEPEDEKTRRTSSVGKIKELKTKHTSAQEVAERRLSGSARAFASTYENIESDITKLEADLVKAKEASDASAQKEITTQLEGKRKQLSELRPDRLELAEDYVYYLEETGQAAQYFGADFEKMGMGEKVSSVYSKSIENEEARQERERRRQENLRDTSSMAFRQEYRQKYGIDPVDIKVKDSRGREVSLTSLGQIGQTPEQVKTQLDEIEVAKKKAEEAKKEAVDKAIEQMIFKLYKEQGISSVRYDPDKVVVDEKAGTVSVPFEYKAKGLADQTQVKYSLSDAGAEQKVRFEALQNVTSALQQSGGGVVTAELVESEYQKLLSSKYKDGVPIAGTSNVNQWYDNFKASQNAVVRANEILQNASTGKPYDRLTIEEIKSLGSQGYKQYRMQLNEIRQAKEDDEEYVYFVPDVSNPYNIQRLPRTGGESVTVSTGTGLTSRYTYDPAKDAITVEPVTAGTVVAEPKRLNLSSNPMEAFATPFENIARTVYYGWGAIVSPDIRKELQTKDIYKPEAEGALIADVLGFVERRLGGENVSLESTLSEYYAKASEEAKERPLSLAASVAGSAVMFLPSVIAKGATTLAKTAGIIGRAPKFGEPGYAAAHLKRLAQLDRQYAVERMRFGRASIDAPKWTESFAGSSPVLNPRPAAGMSLPPATAEGWKNVTFDLGIGEVKVVDLSGKSGGSSAKPPSPPNERPPSSGSVESGKQVMLQIQKEQKAFEEIIVPLNVSGQAEGKLVSIKSAFAETTPSGQTTTAAPMTTGQQAGQSPIAGLGLGGKTGQERVQAKNQQLEQEQQYIAYPAGTAEQQELLRELGIETGPVPTATSGLSGISEKLDRTLDKDLRRMQAEQLKLDQIMMPVTGVGFELEQGQRQQQKQITNQLMDFVLVPDLLEITGLKSETIDIFESVPMEVPTEMPPPPPKKPPFPPKLLTDDSRKGRRKSERKQVLRTGLKKWRVRDYEELFAWTTDEFTRPVKQDKSLPSFLNPLNFRKGKGVKI